METRTDPSMHFIIDKGAGQRDSVAAGFPWGKRPGFPLEEIPIGTTKCIKYNNNEKKEKKKKKKLGVKTAGRRVC